MQSGGACCARGRSAGTGGVLLKHGALPLGPLERRFLQLAAAHAGDPDALLVTRTETVARWSGPDSAAARGTIDGGDLHVVLAVAAEEARLLGGICLEYFPGSSVAVLSALAIDDQYVDA